MKTALNLYNLECLRVNRSEIYLARALGFEDKAVTAVNGYPEIVPLGLHRVISLVQLSETDKIRIGPGGLASSIMVNGLRIRYIDTKQGVVIISEEENKPRERITILEVDAAGNTVLAKEDTGVGVFRYEGGLLSSIFMTVPGHDEVEVLFRYDELNRIAETTSTVESSNELLDRSTFSYEKDEDILTIDYTSTAGPDGSFSVKISQSEDKMTTTLKESEL